MRIFEPRRPGATVARRLARHGRDAIVYDRAVAAEAQGATPAAGPAALVRKPGKPRAVRLVPPAIAPGAIRVLELGDAGIDAMRKGFGRLKAPQP